MSAGESAAGGRQADSQLRSQRGRVAALSPAAADPGKSNRGVFAVLGSPFGSPPFGGGSATLLGMGKQQLHELVDRLPESERGAAARYLEFLLAHDEAAVDPEMLKQIDASRRDQGGDWIAHEEVLREFGVQ